MATYTECKNCGNEEEGANIYECCSCGKLFCDECQGTSLKKLVLLFDVFCPNDGHDIGNKVGYIEKD